MVKADSMWDGLFPNPHTLNVFVNSFTEKALEGLDKVGFCVVFIGPPMSLFEESRKVGVVYPPVFIGEIFLILLIVLVQELEVANKLIHVSVVRYQNSTLWGGEEILEKNNDMIRNYIYLYLYISIYLSIYLCTYIYIYICQGEVASTHFRYHQLCQILM